MTMLRTTAWVWVALFLSMVLTATAPLADAQPVEYSQPPYLQRLFPDKGNVVGGTTITVFGGGFKRGGHIRVRFSAASGEVDEVPGVFVDSGRITCVSPARVTTHDAHVAVSNNGVAFSSFPLIARDEGTYLHFSYVDEVPVGSWVLDVAAGSWKGGTPVTIYDQNHRQSTRHVDRNFLPGKHLRCRFGNARNVSGVTTFNISVTDKTTQHPRFGEGFHKGYVIDALEGVGTNQHAVQNEGATLTLVRGRGYVFSLDETTIGFPFFFTTQEPTNWVENGFVGEYLNVNLSRVEGVSTYNVTLDRETPDFMYYACGRFRAMGGAIRVVDEDEVGNGVANDASGPLFSNRNSVPAVWMSYNKIVCVTPPWDGISDDDKHHGGYQVTVFVTNDGVEFSAGFGDGDGVNAPSGIDETQWQNYPAKAGAGATFTYFDSAPFTDPPRFTPSSTSESQNVALAGGPSASARVPPVDYSSDTSLSSDYFYSYSFAETHSFSDVYDDFGGKRDWQFNKTAVASEAFRNTSDALGLLGDADSTNDPDVFRDDLKVSGIYSGGGLAWFELVVDGVSSTSTSVRWRKHASGVNRTVPWVVTFVDMPVDDLVATPNVVDGVSLGDGLVAGFLNLGLHHQLGDRWTFRVFGGVPGVTSITTTHDEPSIAARGPMEGNTELTLFGSGFFPGEGQLLCRFADADVADSNSGNVVASGVVMTVEAAVHEGDDPKVPRQADRASLYRKITCVTRRHPVVAETGVHPTSLSPCVNKTVTVSHDGGASWSESGAVFFLFCDVFVSVSGSDVMGVGTPRNPYKTLQRAVEASLGRPKFPEKKRQRSFSETAAEGTYGSSGFGTGAVDSSASQNSKQRNNPGYGYVLNRDKITVAGGTYAGNGNRGVHPLGKMVELVGGRGENVVIDCEDSGVGATVSAGDRHATDVAGAIAIANVLEVNCNQRLA